MYSPRAHWVVGVRTWGGILLGRQLRVTLAVYLLLLQAHVQRALWASLQPQWGQVTHRSIVGVGL